MLIGLDVGGTNMTGGLAAADGSLLAKVRRPTDRAGGATAGLALITEIASQLAARAAADGSGVECIGVGFGGPVDYRRGAVLRSHHVGGWEEVALRDELERRFHVPVVVDNDANAGTLGEWRFGAGRGFDDLLYVNVGTGIGGGVIAGGRLIRGARNLAGEIGHTIVVRDGPPCTCGKRGCLEACASGDALGRRGSQAIGRSVSGRELFDLAGEGNAVAQRVLGEVVEDLAHGIGTAVSLLNPAAVIIGGGLSEAPEPLFLEPLRRAIPRYCLDEPGRGLRVNAAELRYDAGVMGAVALALDR
ncbi:MAG TPA: ROK family protein [Vicinamibacterales bacterium]|nr:ROK family protein [Vicinamibacterales bacterium]